MSRRPAAASLASMPSRRNAPIDPHVVIAHVHLQVTDLAVAVAFYTDALGFQLQGCRDGHTAFLSAGDYHHHIALSAGGDQPAHSVGTSCHVFRFPTRALLAAALRRLLDHAVEIHAASDHGTSETVYLTDPDGNRLGLSWDRPRSEWPRTATGGYAQTDLPLDVDALLREHQ